MVLISKRCIDKQLEAAEKHLHRCLTERCLNHHRDSTQIPPSQLMTNSNLSDLNEQQLSPN